MLCSDVVGKARDISFTRKSDASARWTRPRRESAKKVRGTKDRRAKYATIAARWVPRSAKNFATTVRLRRRTGPVSQAVSLPLHGPRSGTCRSHRDLVADPGRRALRRERSRSGLDA